MLDDDRDKKARRALYNDLWKSAHSDHPNWPPPMLDDEQIAERLKSLLNDKKYMSKDEKISIAVVLLIGIVLLIFLTLAIVWIKSTGDATMSETVFIPLFWGIIELFGHNVIAGEIGEETIGGETFIRIDVPRINDEDADLDGYTKYFGKGAVYAITPCDEQTAIRAVKGMRNKPIDLWRLNIPTPFLPEPDEDEDEDPEEIF